MAEFKVKEVEALVEFMKEPMPLPMGMTEFEDWSDRIIQGAMVPGATIESQKFTLAAMLLHLGSTESFKPDGHFIHGLRKAAVSQIAQAKMEEIKKAQAARREAEIQARADEGKGEFLAGVKEVLG